MKNIQKGNSGKEQIFEENRSLKETITDQERLIDKLKEENSKLVSERNKFVERTLYYQESFKNYEYLLSEREEEQTKLREKILNLEKQLANNPTPDKLPQRTKENPPVPNDAIQNPQKLSSPSLAIQVSA